THRIFRATAGGFSRAEDYGRPPALAEGRHQLHAGRLKTRGAEESLELDVYFYTAVHALWLKQNVTFPARFESGLTCPKRTVTTAPSTQPADQSRRSSSR